MYKQLIEQAKRITGVMKFNSSSRNYSGRVGCALLTKNGNIYTGVSIDLVCGLGNCAEYSAICEMVKNQETEIAVIVSIYEGGKIIPPCGRCRELMVEIDENNANTIVIVSENKTILLESLLPFRWN